MRSKTLDILRIIAVLLVLGAHLPACPPETGYWFQKIIRIWQTGGWVGVDLFFVLSGFLISGLLFREHLHLGLIDIKNFLFRRGLKIYPAFYLLIVVTFFYELILNRRIPILSFIGEAIFIQNYTHHYWMHTWSLAVEEHFYLLLSLIFFTLTKTSTVAKEKTFRSLPILFLFVATFCLALRIFNVTHLPFDYNVNQYHTHIRVDSLFCGVIISYFYHYYKNNFLNFSLKYRWKLLVFGFLCFIPPFCTSIKTSFFLKTFGFTFLYLGSASILIGFVPTEPKETKIVRFIAYLGARSYSIYLWHVPVLYCVEFVSNRTGSRWFELFGMYIVGSFLIGVLMSEIIEYPIIRIRDRLFPSRIVR